MIGVIVEGELIGPPPAHPERVLLFAELEAGALSVRRAYGARSMLLTLELDAVEAALAALKAEAARRQPALELAPEADA